MAERVNKFEILAATTKRTINERYSTKVDDQIDIDLIIPFKNHPYKVIDDEEMEDLVESIKEYGVITPIIARKVEDKIEIISGHRRVHAAKKIGLKKIPVYLKDINDDEAVILLVDSNKQREKVLPSERAWSLRMKVEALKHQGKKICTETTSEQIVPKLSKDDSGTTSEQIVPKLNTSELIGAENNISHMQVKRYIRLTYLIPDLLDMVDNNKLGFCVAVDISYLAEEHQSWVLEWIRNNHTVSPEQISLLRQQAKEDITYNDFIKILNSSKPVKKEPTKVTFTQKKLDKYFPSDMSVKQREDIIIELLERWKSEFTL